MNYRNAFSILIILILKLKAVETGQWIKALAGRPDDMGLISGTQMMKIETESLSFSVCLSACFSLLHTHTQINLKNLKTDITKLNYCEM